MPPNNKDQGFSPTPTQPSRPNPQDISPPQNPKTPPERPAFTAPSQPIDTPPPPPTKTSGKRGLGKRFWLIIAAAVLVVLAAVGVAAYTVYNQPDRIVKDAFRSALAANTAEYDGSLAFAPKAVEGEPEGKVTINFNGQSNRDIGQINFDLDVSMPPFNLDVGGSFIANREGDTYLKVDEAGKILTNFFGEEITTDPEFSEFVQKVDGKWIVFTAEDAEQPEDDEASCVIEALEQFAASKEEQDEMFRFYEENQFVTVKNELGTEKIGDSTSLGFELDVDEGEAKDFFSATENLPLAKRVTDCTGTSEKDEDGEESVPDVTVKVWADQWSHELTRFEVAVNDDDASMTFTMNTRLDRPVEVAVPTEDVTPFKDIEEDLQGLMFLLMLGGGSEEAFPLDLGTFITT